MDPIAAFWHVLNFFVPALGTAVVAGSLAKLMWRRDLRGVPWVRLCGWAAAACAAVLALGLIAFGRDGVMTTYVAMVSACAGTLWWVGFKAARR